MSIRFFLTILGTFCGLAAATFVSAADDFVALAEIPGVTDSTRSIATYLNALFRIAVGVGAFLAVIKITLAGIKYMSNDAFSSKEVAKKDIQGALLGLLIILSTVIILNIINPQILNLNVFDSIQGGDAAEEAGRAAAEAEAAGAGFVACAANTSGNACQDSCSRTGGQFVPPGPSGGSGGCIPPNASGPDRGNGGDSNDGSNNQPTSPGGRGGPAGSGDNSDSGNNGTGGTGATGTGGDGDGSRGDTGTGPTSPGGRGGPAGSGDTSDNSTGDAEEELGGEDYPCLSSEPEAIFNSCVQGCANAGGTAVNAPNNTPGGSNDIICTFN